MEEFFERKIFKKEETPKGIKEKSGENNREKMKEYHKDYYQKHKNEIKEYKKDYYQKHKNEIKE